MHTLTAKIPSPRPRPKLSPKLNSLGFARRPQDTRVVVAMSGGVDSSVVAGMLAAEGYEVVGITLQLYDHNKIAGTGSPRKKGACCAGADVYDAKRVAATLGIQHYVLDYESRFREAVIDTFADDYIKGRTPVPCITCNQTVKFNDLLATAKELDAACLATGHYVQRVASSDGSVRLLRGIDTSKDQSYFLFATTPPQLEFLRFPLGGMEKTATRRLAAELGLATADKPDSQDICFVGSGGYGALVRRLRPGAGEAGDIVDRTGRVLGQHQGVIDFTIGQRRGLGIGGRADGFGEGEAGDEAGRAGDAGGDAVAAGEIGGDNAPLYVVALRPRARQVVVGRKEDLACRRVVLRDCNWLGDAAMLARVREGAGGEGGQGEGSQRGGGVEVLVRLRNTGRAEPAEIVAWGEDGDGVGAEVVLRTPQYGVAAGQAAVVYSVEEPEWVLGGGWITRAPTAADGLGE
ncbi:MAG: tRNA 2-thiouridine(34) synthase MnmA [Proteobacteria bacterium]|nr:tRNA 2-thiouridine(34) synthase MnmA [Pseudomonadota bacterium]